VVTAAAMAAGIMVADIMVADITGEATTIAAADTTMVECIIITPAATIMVTTAATATGSGETAYGSAPMATSAAVVATNTTGGWRLAAPIGGTDTTPACTERTS
jgi:hypothetical protein